MSINLTNPVQYWGRDIEILVYCDGLIPSGYPIVSISNIYGDLLTSGGCFDGPYAGTYAYVVDFADTISGGNYYFDFDTSDPSEELMGSFSYDTNGILDKDTQYQFVKATSVDLERNVKADMVDGFYVRVKNPESTDFSNPLMEDYIKLAYDEVSEQADITYKNYVNENE